MLAIFINWFIATLNFVVILWLFVILPKWIQYSHVHRSNVYNIWLYTYINGYKCNEICTLIAPTNIPQDIEHQAICTYASSVLKANLVKFMWLKKHFFCLIFDLLFRKLVQTKKSGEFHSHKFLQFFFFILFVSSYCVHRWDQRGKIIRSKINTLTSTQIQIQVKILKLIGLSQGICLNENGYFYHANICWCVLLMQCCLAGGNEDR